MYEKSNLKEVAFEIYKSLVSNECWMKAAIDLSDNGNEAITNLVKTSYITAEIFINYDYNKEK